MNMWWLFVGLSYVYSVFISGMVEKVYFNGQVMSVLQAFMTYRDVPVPVFGIITIHIPWVTINWLIVWKMFQWDYSFLQGDVGTIIRVVLMAFGIFGVLIPFLMWVANLIRGN